MSDSKVLARPGQELKHHLVGVGNKAEIFADKIDLAIVGKLLGLLHDLGKYALAFQIYIHTIAGIKNPDIDEIIDVKASKGKIDHSTAGAQWIWHTLEIYGNAGRLCGQILAICIASHHSGLIDCLKVNTLDENEVNGFLTRIKKEDADTHLQESLRIADQNILDNISQLATISLVETLIKKINQITHPHQHGQKIPPKIQAFYLGMLTRLLFSCLIDADRLDSAKRNPDIASRDWQIPIDRLETYINNLPVQNPIDILRRKISDECLARAAAPQGIYTLTVPTGGGKTLASLRYALHHAQKYKLDRIIYIVPFTTIIEQNAEVIRSIIESPTDSNLWVLEHHSNLEPEQETEHSKLAAENWESPIIITTMVQFLETLFAGGTKSVRRMHQLAKSVLIFDEIQKLPVNCTHLFCNAINFLSAHTGTTAILCTATQPLLNELRSPDKGQLYLSKNHELISDVQQLFVELNRVDIIPILKSPGWRADEITELALREFNEQGSCLVVVNTKSWAHELYQRCKHSIPHDAIFHLSTNQCPAHRKKILAEINRRLKEKLPVLCFSTNLIEAGVDVSFASVIRFLAGLDSILQAAGRCNRHGELKNKLGTPIKGRFYVINPEVENINNLTEIKIGREKARQVMNEFNGVMNIEAIQRYFRYYFFERTKDMDYPLSINEVGLNTSLLNLLANNSDNAFYGHYEKIPMLSQSFMTAGKAFKVIDAPTHSIIIQYGEGRELVSQICGIAKEYNAQEYYQLLRKAQHYSINVYSNVWQELIKKKAIIPIQEKEGIYFLEEKFYCEAYGLSLMGEGEMSFSAV